MWEGAAVGQPAVVDRVLEQIFKTAGVEIYKPERLICKRFGVLAALLPVERKGQHRWVVAGTKNRAKIAMEHLAHGSSEFDPLLFNVLKNRLDVAAFIYGFLAGNKLFGLFNTFG